MTQEGKNPDKEPRFAVTVDHASYASMSSVQRRKIEDEAIRQILAATPEKYRTKMADLLRRDLDPQTLGYSSGQVGAFAFQGSSDPEIARLLGVVSSVRAAELAESPPRVAAAAAPSVTAGTRVFVTVVFDGSRTTGSTAIIRPGYALPILVLQRNADAAELSAGIRAAARLYRDFGPSPSREYTAQIDVAENDPAPSPQTAQLLALIREGDARDVPGVGHLPATEVVTYTK